MHCFNARSANPWFLLLFGVALSFVWSPVPAFDCEENKILFSHGDMRAGYALAVDYAQPGGCGWNVRKAYRYVEAAKETIPPDAGLASYQNSASALYLLAAWARRDRAKPTYALDPALTQEHDIEDLAHEIVNQRKPQTEAIPPISQKPVSSAWRAMVSVLHQDTPSVDAVRKAVLESLQALSHSGYVQASYELAIYYSLSTDSQDASRAVSLLKNAATKGHRPAAVKLGQFAEHGQLGEANNALACAIYDIVDAYGCPTATPSRPDGRYQPLLRRIAASQRSSTAYKKFSVPYESTSTKGLWWIREASFDF